MSHYKLKKSLSLLPKRVQKPLDQHCLFCYLASAGESIREKSAAAESHRRLIRNRRNISWYKQHSDFWNWYKYFTDNGNQEAVSIRTSTRVIGSLCP